MTLPVLQQVWETGNRYHRVTENMGNVGDYVLRHTVGRVNKSHRKDYGENETVVRTFRLNDSEIMSKLAKFATLSQLHLAPDCQHITVDAREYRVSTRGCDCSTFLKRAPL